MVLPNSPAVPLIAGYLGTLTRKHRTVLLTGLSPSWAGRSRPFGYRSVRFLPARILGSRPQAPHDPQRATPQGLTPFRFGLFRFRSPLLTESNFFFLLGLLRCFTSPRFASFPYGFREGYLDDSRWVAPFGNPRIKACLRLPEAYRSLPRPSSPLSAKSSTNGP